MIHLYLDDTRYIIVTDEGVSKRSFDAPDSVNNAALKYFLRWHIFNSSIEDLLSWFSPDPKKDDITIYSDSRLIEELAGDIKSENQYAQNCINYFKLYDSIRFKRINYQKCGTSTIEDKWNFTFCE